MLSAAADDCPLTDRQRAVVLLAMRGLTYDQIGLEMGITGSAVRDHINAARRRLGVVGAGRGALFAVMLTRGWATPQQIAPQDSYSTWLQATKSDRDWRPSAAQRCYLNAFNRLVAQRDPHAAVAVSLAFALMCFEAGASPPKARQASLAHLDDMLLRVARGVTRPIPVD